MNYGEQQHNKEDSSPAERAAGSRVRPPAADWIKGVIHLFLQQTGRLGAVIDRPEVATTCGRNLSDLFASSQSDKQRDCGPCLFTKDAARTHIPVCFRSSTQAQSQGFPLSDRVKKGYNITSFCSERGAGWVLARAEGLLSFTL